MGYMDVSLRNVDPASLPVCCSHKESIKAACSHLGRQRDILREKMTRH